VNAVIDGFRRNGLRVLALLVLGPLGGCNDPEPALNRGDRLWADAAYTDALAEYRLAAVQGGRDESTQLRVAHAYARIDQLDRAREAYQRLLARAPEYTDQAIHDYLALARRAVARGDRYALVGAVEAALSLRPDLPIPDLAPALARYYTDTGEPARALEFYQRALATAPPDSVPVILHQIGLILASQGNCHAAIGYFSAVLQRVPARSERAAEARWRSGNCAFELGRQARQTGEITAALEHFEAVIEFGVPENLQDQAWFERGEILFALGRFDEALESYRRVLDLTGTRGGLLAERARRRIDQVRFGT